MAFVPYDWTGFLKTHLYDTPASARRSLALPTMATELVYTDQRSAYLKNRDRSANMSISATRSA